MAKCVSLASIVFTLCFSEIAFAQAQEEGLLLDDKSSVVDLTDEIGTFKQIDETEGSDYPQGVLMQVRLTNDTTKDLTRIVVFSSPLLLKSGLLGAGLKRPHVADLYIGEGEAALEILPESRGKDYAVARLILPAGETVTLRFSHEGSLRGVGIFLWEPGSLSEFRQYRTWSDGVFLGVISVLLAFSAGAALIEWSRAAAARLFFVGAAWFVVLSVLDVSQSMLTRLETATI